MKLLVTIFLVLLLFPSAHALSLNLESSYGQSETVVAEIQGVILTPIAPSQVTFKRGHVETAISYGLQRLGDRYFVYFVTPRSQNNYTLTLSDVDTMVNGERRLVTLETPFTTSNQSAPYSIRPGIINTANDFDIEFTSFSDQPTAINIGSPLNSQMTIQQGITTRTFPINVFPLGLSSFSLGMYNLQVYNSAEANNFLPASHFVDISPRHIEHIFVRGREAPFSFTVRNIGTEDLENIVIVYNESRYSLTPKTIDRIKSNESAMVNITLVEFTGSVEDRITLNAGNESIEIPLRISYNETSATPLQNTSSNSSTQGYYCNELGGKLCSSTEICQGSIVTSLSGSCCIGLCATPPKSSLAWIGYVIGAIVLIILVIIGGKYMKSKTPSKAVGLAGRVAKIEHS